MKSRSHVRLFATPWTVACQTPLSMGFSRQEYWSGLPFPSPGDLPDPGMEPGSPALQAGSLLSEPAGKPCLQFMHIYLKLPLPSLLILSLFSITQIFVCSLTHSIICTGLLLHAKYCSRYLNKIQILVFVEFTCY